VALAVDTMDIFISWAGDRSHALAVALKQWLPMVMNAVRPWLSSSDIESGSRWSTEVAGRLERANFGIICLTPHSLRSEWVLFEAGALSKTVLGTHVCPVLIDLNPSDVAGPLAQFQSVKADANGIKKLIATINAAFGEDRLPDAQLTEVFTLLWPGLKEKLDSLPADGTAQTSKRDTRDMIEELLHLVRRLANNPGSANSSSATLTVTEQLLNDKKLDQFTEIARNAVRRLLGETATAIVGYSHHGPGLVSVKVSRRGMGLFESHLPVGSNEEFGRALDSSLRAEYGRQIGLSPDSQVDPEPAH
jgi:hypothetical protein